MSPTKDIDIIEAEEQETIEKLSPLAKEVREVLIDDVNSDYNAVVDKMNELGDEYVKKKYGILKKPQ